MDVVQPMSQSIDTGLTQNEARGAAMEVHAGTISVGAGRIIKPRRRLLQLREGLRRRRAQRAERAYSLRMNGTSARSIAGSEHAHLIHRPRGF
jgi:hypothetical protein